MIHRAFDEADTFSCTQTFRLDDAVSPAGADIVFDVCALRASDTDSSHATSRPFPRSGSSPPSDRQHLPKARIFDSDPDTRKFVHNPDDLRSGLGFRILGYVLTPEPIRARVPLRPTPLLPGARP